MQFQPPGTANFERHQAKTPGMLKSVYSSEFVGTACSKIDERMSYGLALLPSYPSFDVSIVDKEYSRDGSSALEQRVCISSDGSIPLSKTVEVLAESGDRFQFKDFKSFAESGVLEGCPVSFNFDGIGISQSETKAIHAGVVYYVKSIDVASSPPFFSVASQRGAGAAVGFKKISCPKGSKLEATFHIIEEGTPVSFGFDIANPAPNTDVLKAGVVVYARDVQIDAPSSSPPRVFFRVSLRPGQQQEPISIAGVGQVRGRAQLHIANKMVRALKVTQEKCIVKAAALSNAPILDTLPIPFYSPADSLTPEMLQTVCSSAFDLDVHLLHALSNFTSACKFFDVSFPASLSTYQQRMVQETQKHMENFIKPFRRDVGSLELVEYASFRLLCLNALLLSHPLSSRLEKQIESVSKRVQAAWNVINLYGTTVLFDCDGMPTKDPWQSVQRSCCAFCVCDGVFALARNGFFVIGKADTGQCISLKVDGFTKSDAAESGRFVPASGLRPCVVDAKFVESSLYLMILTSPASHVTNVIAHIFKVDGISFASDEMVHSVSLRKVSREPFHVGTCFPFNVFIPKFVAKPPRMTQYMHVFAIECIHRNPRIHSVSLADSSAQSCELNFQTRTPQIDLGTFEFLSSAIVQRPSQQQMSQDLWVLCRGRGIKLESASTKVLLWRFALGKSGSTITSTLVEEVGLEIPRQDQQGPPHLWELCLTNYGLGVGVASPEGHFYHVVKSDLDALAFRKVESPFFADGRSLSYAKYVRLLVVKSSRSPLPPFCSL
jgi:hypothetical protein